VRRFWLAALVAACSTKAPPPAPPRTPAAPAPKDAAVETDDGRARALLDKLAAHDYAGAEASFDDQMRAALPADKLAAVWSQLEAQVGAFERVDAIDVKPSRDRHVAVAKATFAHAPLVFTITIDAAGKIGGFFVRPGDTADAWQSPPYAKQDAFTEEQVTIGSSPALPGTLTLPKGAAHVPVLVLVHGSGPNDRDETIGAQKPFKDLAWGLASRGIAVLRYDKRTHVSTAPVRTQHEEVDEAAHAAIALVRARPEIDPARVALLGHSQGGYLAPRIAKDDPAIRRLVILAGSTRPLEDSLVAQLQYMRTLKPGDASLGALIAEAERFKAAVESPSLKPDDQLKFPIGGVELPGSYFLDVRGYHPARVAAKLAIPILVLQGERDYQVTVDGDFAAWKAALAHDPRATLRTYPGLTHAFTPGGDPPSPADYQKPAHVDEQVIADVAAFLSAP
jgi:dienelactone hydrolase